MSSYVDDTRKERQEKVESLGLLGAPSLAADRISSSVMDSVTSQPLAADTTSQKSQGEPKAQDGCINIIDVGFLYRFLNEDSLVIKR